MLTCKQDDSSKQNGTATAQTDMQQRGDGRVASDRLKTWLEETHKQAPFYGSADGKPAKTGSTSDDIKQEMCEEPKGRAHL